MLKNNISKNITIPPKSSLPPLKLPKISSNIKAINTLNNSSSMHAIRSLNPKTFEKRPKKNKNLNMSLHAQELVKNLDIDINPNIIMSREAELKKMKENIDNNIDIINKRMGKYKKNNQTNDEKDIESKEKVKIFEKKYNEDLTEYKSLKEEKEKLGKHILNLYNIIDDYKLDLYTYDNYTKNLYSQFLEKKEEKKAQILAKMGKLKYENIDEYILLDKELNKLDMNDKDKFQEEIKIKKQNINENLIKTYELLEQLQSQKSSLNDITKNLKNKIKENKINLIRLYHLSLYEGLDFRYEGLSSVIRAIWNLGVDVDMNYMPKYLDKVLVNFLFEHAKMVIKMNNLRTQLDKAKSKFLKELEEWKNINVFDNIKLPSNNNSDVDLFKTKLDNSDNKYPKTEKFMKNYYNKHYDMIDNKEKNELNDYRKSRLESKIEIPKKYLEEHKTIEKGKIILKNLELKIKNMEKNEIMRVCREFCFNNYENVYKVCPYIIVSAICGNEYKDEGIMFYNMMEREINDNKRIIRFFDIKKSKINL